MKRDTDDFNRWLSYQNTPIHWDGWEWSTAIRLMKKAWKAGRKYERRTAKGDAKP